MKALLKSRLKAYQEVEVGGSSELLKQVEDGEGENCVLGRLEPEQLNMTASRFSCQLSSAMKCLAVIRELRDILSIYRNSMVNNTSPLSTRR